MLASAVVDARLKGRTILLLAPQEGWINDVAFAFREAGAAVHLAHDADSASTLFETEDIDAVVYDEHRLQKDAGELETRLSEASEEKRRAPLIAIDDRDRRDTDNHELAHVVVDSVAQMIAMRWN